MTNRRLPDFIITNPPYGGEFIRCAELADLPCAGLPRGKFPSDRKWCRLSILKLGIATFEKRGLGGAALAVRIADLPADTRAALAQSRHGNAAASTDADAAAWSWYAGISTKRQALAEAKLAALLAVEKYCTEGKTLTAAIAESAAESGQATPTIHRDRAKVRDVPRANWLPTLAKKSGAGRARVEISEEAWSFFGAFLREAADRCPLTVAYEKTAKVAKREGWAWPAYSTVHARWSEFSAGARALIKSGPKAHDATVPTRRRSVAKLQAMRVVNLDGRQADVFVEFEDGTTGRPIVIAIQDVYSRAFLGWVVAKTENSDATKAAILKVLDRYGLFDELVTDNGRAFASKKISGGAPHRFRWKSGNDEVSGLLELIGARVRFARPYSGRSKPIERGFRDVAQRIDTLPEFRGAYCGHRPDAKPEDFAGRAVPIAEFRAVYDREIAAHNAKPGRRTEMGKGKLSFDQVFAESYRQRPSRPIVPAQRRYFLFDIAYLKPHRDTGALASGGFTWWAPEHQATLLKYRNSKVRVLFDPSDRSAPVMVEDMKGHVIVESLRCLREGEFLSTDDARDVARRRTRIKKLDRAKIEELNLISRTQMNQYLHAAESAAAPPTPAVPDTNLVAPAFKAPRIRSIGGIPAAKQSVAEIARDKFNASIERSVDRDWDELMRRRRMGG